MATVMIWDGAEFDHVTSKQAKALAKADKAQIMDGTVDGLALKHRHEFTGYNVAPEPPVPAPAPPTEKATAVQGITKPAPMKDWRTYKKVVARKLNIAPNTVRKAQVLEYLEREKHGAD